MGDSSFNKIVKKLLNYKGKLIDTENIKSVVEKVMAENYAEKKTYKIIYFLKNRWYLLSIKKDIFYVKEHDDEISEDDLIDIHYWTILKKHCTKYLGTKWYIGWFKSMQFHLKDQSIPEEIDIINERKQSKEVVVSGNSTKYFIKHKKYSIKKVNLFSKFKKHTEKIKIWTTTFNYSCLELSILESLYSPDIIYENTINETIKKLLRKYKKTLNFEIITDIIQLWKHHSSINRLYNIAKWVDEKLADGIWQIIKKHSFFLEIK